MDRGQVDAAAEGASALRRGCPCRADGARGAPSELVVGRIGGLRLEFDSTTGEDEDAFYATRDLLLDEFDRWRSDRGERDDGMVVSNASLFLDWRYSYSSGVLNDYDGADVREFLIEWCPRKLTAPADMASGLCQAVGGFVQFMAATGRLVGGGRRADALTAYAKELAPEVRRTMSDPSNFGMAKSLFGGALGDLPDADDMEGLQALLDQKMAEFNALSYEERKALTDPHMQPPSELQRRELNFVHIPPPAAKVTAAATSAPIAGKIEALRDYLGAEGKALTEKGNLKLVDGRALVELLDTGDAVDQTYGDRTVKTTSTQELRWLQLIVGLAKAAGAVRVNRRRLVPVKAWEKRDPADRCSAVLAAAVDEGPLWMLFHDSYTDNVIKELGDESLVHWLTMLLPADAVPFDDIAETVRRVVTQQVAPQQPYWTEDRIAESATDDLAWLIEMMELLGVVRWDDREEIPDDKFRTTYPRGGSLSLTDLGKYAVPKLAHEAGYEFRTVDDLDRAAPAALFDAMNEVDEEDLPGVIGSWRSDLGPGERARLVADAVLHADSAQHRLAGMAVLERLGIEESAPYVRELLDSPVGGHAASWLLAHDQADPDELAHYIDIAFLVDVLAACQDTPEVMCELFCKPSPLGGPYELLEQVWRNDAPETAAVLETLGQHLSDARLAKAARKALFKHRSRAAQR